ncbi:hypothetical protein Brms1b_011956 [Colletotrichum noveboracense]|nr:hypothetical protein Brms1b_011956 [Colletotrichum noveboracense]
MSSLLLTSLLLYLTSAHVVLENPKPFKFVADGPTNPISATGDDFPCKVPPGASYIVDGERTVYAVGEPQTATFAGQAVHGGGSCQFALSTDTEPTKQSTWMVIHSIEGGCPARNQKGNLEGPNKDEYTFSIPQGIAPGEYTFAWTWQARVGGQPEYYMNCAPITVVASKKKRGHAREGWRTSPAKRQTQFPELFMANMGEVSGGCTTDEALTAQVPIKYPNAGTSVDHPEGEANLFVQPCDGNPRAGAGSGGGGPFEPPAASASSAAPGEEKPEPTTSYMDTPPAEPTSPSSEIDTPAVTSPPVVSTTAPERPAPSCAVPAVSTVEVTVTVTATITAQVPVASGAPDAPADEDDDEDDDEACTEGYLTCLEDETHFATCTGGQLTAPQPIAPGFKCAAGEGEGLDISPIGGY